MLESAYILLFVVLYGAILLIYNSSLKKNEISSATRFKRIGIVTAVVSLWLGYIYFLTTRGTLLSPTMPPKLPLLVILPLIIFTFVFLRLNRRNRILHSVPIHIPIFFQSFRVIIEIMFVYTFAAGILPSEVTFEGYNFDIVIGATAPVIGFIALRKGSKTLLIAWNFVGILFVLSAAFTFITSFYFPQIWGYEVSQVSPEFGTYPYILLPAFFFPLAIFGHVFSLVQLGKKERLEEPVSG